MSVAQDVAKSEKEAREFISMVGRYSEFDENITWHMTVLGTAKAPFNVEKFRNAALSTLKWNPFKVLNAAQSKTAGEILDNLTEAYDAAGIDYEIAPNAATAREQLIQAFKQFENE